MLELKKLIQIWRLKRGFLKGFKIFQRSGKTPDWAYHNMRKLFILTNGVFNDKMAKRLSVPKYKIDSPNGILGNCTNDDLKSFLDGMSNNGYYIFDKELPSEIISSITSFAESSPCLMFKSDQTMEYVKTEKYDRKNPRSSQYKFHINDLYQDEDVQKLIVDESMLYYAQEYLNSRVILDNVSMWWSPVYQKKASDAAAQLYHFDMHRIKFVKFFIYLTDVTENTGPHCYVENTHRKLDKKILKDGRIPDHELIEIYGKDRMKELTGKKGTIICVDTRGLHKGKIPTESDRLLLQFDYTLSLFGEPFEKVNIRDIQNQDFINALDQRPDTFRAITEG